jgi:hypothetical protein
VAPYLPEVRLGHIGSSRCERGATRCDFRGTRCESGGPDVNPGFTHSVPIDQSLSFSPSVSVKPVGKEKQERPEERTEEARHESNPNLITEWNDRNHPDRRDRRGYG